MPKISVILTSFNHAPFIKEAIDSVLSQTFTDFELIIWDDASKDNSWEIIQSYSDSRIKAFKNEVQKRGIYGINKAISEVAKGQYIAIHHSDDVWELDKLEKQLKVLEENSQYGAVFTNATIINEEGKVFEDKNHCYYSIFDQKNRSKEEWLNYFFFSGNALCHPSVLIRKECYNECGLYRYGIAQLADFDMWIRLCLKYEINIIPEKLIKFRILNNEANTSGNRPETRIRGLTEHFYIFNNFLELDTYEKIEKVFPEAKKYSNTDGCITKFILAMMSMSNRSHDIHLFGLSLLYDIVNNENDAKKAKKLYDFSYINLIELSKKYDIFNIEKDQQIQEKDQQIQEKDQQIHHLNEIAQSLRIKNRIKRVVKKIIPEKLWKIMRYIKHNPSAVSLGMHTLRTQGFRALLQKIKKVNVLPEERINNTYQYFEPELTAKVRTEISAFEYKPLISIIMPVYNVDPKWLRLAIASIEKQWYTDWELCIADDKSTNRETIDYLKSLSNPKIKMTFLEENLNISGASNEALKLATGEYIALMDNDDELTPDALYEVVKAINEHNAEFIYSDEDFVSISGEYGNPHFKPDFSPDLLLSHNYITHFTCFKKSILDKVGCFMTEFDGAQDYDLFLRLTEHANDIYHIQKVLYHWRTLETSTSANAEAKPEALERGKHAVEKALQRRGIDGYVENANLHHYFRVRYTIKNNPLVSIVIPFKDKPELLEMCICSILEKSSYQNYEIIGISNNSEESETFKMMKALEVKDSRISFYEYNVPFNYSDINNHAVNSYAKGSHILLLNNDIEIISSEWIESMLELSQREEVGCVGAKLYYPDDTIQHAGIIVGLGGYAGHSHKMLPRKYHGYFNRLNIIQNVSAVTAACLMVKKSIYVEVGGLDDEKFKVAYNDVDFCLRVREKGYLNLFTPYAEAYHHESISRGYEVIPEKIARFEMEKNALYERHKTILQKGDPYYNPNLTLDREDFSLK